MSKKILIIDRKLRKYSLDPGMEKVLEKLKEKEISNFWVLVNPDIQEKNNEKIVLENFKEFEDYNTTNVIEILEKEKPDLVLLFNDYDFIIRSFIPAAKFLKIPCVLLLTLPSPSSYLDKLTIGQMKNKLTLHKNRKNELFKKFKIMIKNYKNAKYSKLKIMKIIINDFIVAISRYQPIGEYECDIVLVSGNDWKKDLEQKKVNSIVKVVGYLRMDFLYNQITRDLEKYTKINNKSNIVILTTPLVEHGLWTEEKWENTITEILTEIDPKRKNDIEISLKIHPSSEKIEKYQKLLKKLKINIPIYQKENLYEIIRQADLIVTYGYSSGTFEAVLLNKPIIVANFFQYPLDNMPFVKEGIIQEITNSKNLLKITESKEDFKPNKEKLHEYIEKYIFKFDGNSCTRTADVLIKKIN